MRALFILKLRRRSIESLSFAYICNLRLGCNLCYSIRSLGTDILFFMFKKINFFLLVFFFGLPFGARAQFEKIHDSIVQIYGVVLEMDSFTVIPNVSVSVKGTNRSTLSNAQGVFSIVAEKGDALVFNHIIYKQREQAIPQHINGNMYSMVEVMGHDTLRLPEAVITARPSKAAFEREFIAFRDVSALNEIAKGNASPLNLELLNTSIIANDKTAQINATLLNRNQPYNTGSLNLFNVFVPSTWKNIIRDFKRKPKIKADN